MKKILFFLLFLISTFANATNYYIKTGGNDANTGLSDAQAWATVGRVYDERNNFLPGDSILFRAGNTFTQTDANDEVLYMTVSGTQYLHIVYSSYGAGANPIFTAIDTVSGGQKPSNWSEYLGGGTHIWRMLWPRTYGTINRERIWLNGVEQVRKKNRTVTAAEPVFSSGDSLYIYNAVGNPATQYTTIRCHSDWQVFVQAYDKEYIDISNLDIRGYTEAMAFGGVNYFNIHDCNIGYDCGTDGIAISRATTSTRYVNIYNNTFQTNDTISMHTWEAKNTEDGVRIGSDSYYINVYNNEFYNWDHTCVYIYASDLIYPISNVKVYNNYMTAKDIDYGRALGGDIRNESQALNIEVYNNFIEEMACQSQFQIPNAKIHHNIFTGTKEVWWSATHPDGHALSIQGYYAPTMGMEITNNVFANNTGVGLIINNDETYYETKGILIANNIFFGNIGHVLDQNYADLGNSGLQMMIQDYTTTGDNDYKNNLFYKVGTTDLVYYGGGGLVDPVKTVAEFNALTGTDGDVITDNINVSPSFTNGNGDYSDDSDFNLLAASLAIDEGLDVGSVTDYLGNPIPIGPAPDIGAYEWGSVVPPYWSPTGVGWERNRFKINFRDSVNFSKGFMISGVPISAVGSGLQILAGLTASVNDLNNTEGSTGNFQAQIDGIAAVNYPGSTHWYAITSSISYLHFKGLTVRNIWQLKGTDEVYGWYMSGHDVIWENCKTYNIGGVGLRTFAMDNVYFINCDAWHCCDYLSSYNPGGKGSGFSVMNWDGTPADYVKFTNCRAWMCSDQGFSSPSNGYIEYDGCWAFSNGYLQGYGIVGNGFKEGWIEDVFYGVTQKLYKNCVAAFNQGFGFNTNDRNYEAFRTLHYNNTSYHNGYYGFLVEDPPLSSDAEQLQRTYRNNIAYANGISNFALAWPDAKATYDHNSWDISGLTLNASDFVSLDSTGITAARQADGSLPNNNCYNYFLRLSENSAAIDRGVDVGLPYTASAPDLGAFEFGDYVIPPTTPTLNTTYPVITYTHQATSGGYTIFAGGTAITSKGLVWEVDTLPTLGSNIVWCGSDSTDFVGTITGLQANTKYHVRAFATNMAALTGYGNDLPFTTDNQGYIRHTNKYVFHNGKIVMIK